MKKYFVAGCLSLCFVFSSCYSWFAGSVEMNKTGNYGTLSDLLNKPVTISKLDTPEQIMVSKEMYSDRIVVTWSSIKDAGSYRVERAEVLKNIDGTFDMPNEEDFNVVKEFCYETKFTDRILQNASYNNIEYDKRYYYRVCAENIGKGYVASEFTEVAQDKYGSLFAPPKNLNATKGKSFTEINLTWDKMTGVTSFAIFRGERESGTGMECIASNISGNQNSYSDSILAIDQGKELYYKIVAYKTSSNSAYSSIAMGFTLMEGSPATPENVRVLNGKGESVSSLKIAWDKIEQQEGQTLTYTIYRTSSEDSQFVKIKDKINANVTSYEDTSNLVPGISYYYYVMSVAVKTEDGTVLKSAFSESGPDALVPATGYLLSAPTILRTADAEDPSDVVLMFMPSIGEADSVNGFVYNIYCSDERSNILNYSKCDEKIYSKSDSVDENGFYNVVLKKSSYFRVTTTNLDFDGSKESEFSNPIDPFPEAPVNVRASKNEKLLKDFEVNSHGVYSVRITWEEPEGIIPTAYNVYRSNSPDGSFRKLNTLPVYGSEFIDMNENAVPGVFYYYKVISLNSVHEGNKGNNPSNDTLRLSWGYGAITADYWFREYNKTVFSSQKKLTLMHKPNDMDKIGSETINGSISGTLGYKAAVQGLGARITMPYKNYADYYILDNPEYGVYFLLNGDTNTTSNMQGNGNMDGVVNCQGMYPGYVDYRNLVIKSGAAGSGWYEVTTLDCNGNEILSNVKVDWLVGEEGK